jgi:hypothetical protein
MRSKIELQMLYTKFDNDVKTKSRGLRLAISLDQFFGVLIWNNSQDETISSKIGRKKLLGTTNWFEDRLCCLLSKLEYNHCYKSMGE